MKTPSDFCRCPACLPSIPPDPATATPAELAAHAGHLRKLAAIGALPDPVFQPYPTQQLRAVYWTQLDTLKKSQPCQR